jgi:DNA-binding NarL/FixJ family response regulator
MASLLLGPSSVGREYSRRHTSQGTMASVTPLVVAVLDSDPDTTALLKSCLEIEGLVVAIGNLTDFRLGRGNLIEFLQRAGPDVIIYDLGIPYEANATYLQKARQHPAFPRCGLVVTTTNPLAVQNLLGIQAVEILGKPYDLAALIHAVRAAAAGETPFTDPFPADTGARPFVERRRGDRRAGVSPEADRRLHQSTGVHESQGSPGTATSDRGAAPTPYSRCRDGTCSPSATPDRAPAPPGRRCPA